jgi:hypothetical protein
MKNSGGSGFFSSLVSLRSLLSLFCFSCRTGA